MSRDNPTTSEVRSAAAPGRGSNWIEHAAFNRWFDEEIRKAKHEAFERGVYQAESDIERGIETFVNPYEKEV